MDGLQSEGLRMKARELVESVVPYTYGDAHFNEVCKFYQKGFGTSCGCLCHWMLYYLGAKNPDIVNWTDTERGLKYLGGANVSRIHHKGMAPFVNCIGPSNPLLRGVRPSCGDIVFIHKFNDDRTFGPQNKEHVFIFLEEQAGGRWSTAESGQEGGTDSKFKFRMLFAPTGEVKPATPVRISDADGAKPSDGDRTVIGWLDISQLDYLPDSLTLFRQMGRCGF